MCRSITLRAIRSSDQPFLYRVYASTRELELAPLGWSEGQKAAFLQMQFNAQHRYYVEQFPRAAFHIILSGNRAVGRLYVDRRTDEIRLLDIALLPEHRNAGIGTALLRGLLAEAERAGMPVRIHVERLNPALRLYRRLGFCQIADKGVYTLLEWSPACASQADQAKTAS